MMYDRLSVRRGIRRAFSQMHLPLTRAMLAWLMREIEAEQHMAFGRPDDPVTPLASALTTILAPGFGQPIPDGYRPEDPGAPPLDLSEFADEPRRNPLPVADPDFTVVNLANRMLYFDYVNHRGEDKSYKVTFTGMAFGTVKDYYRFPTLLLVGWCHHARAVRSFDTAKMRNIRVP